MTTLENCEFCVIEGYDISYYDETTSTDDAETNFNKEIDKIRDIDSTVSDFLECDDTTSSVAFHISDNSLELANENITSSVSDQESDNSLELVDEDEVKQYWYKMEDSTIKDSDTAVVILKQPDVKKFFKIMTKYENLLDECTQLNNYDEIHVWVNRSSYNSDTEYAEFLNTLKADLEDFSPIVKYKSYIQTYVHTFNSAIQKIYDDFRKAHGYHSLGGISTGCSKDGYDYRIYIYKNKYENTTAFENAIEELVTVLKAQGFPCQKTYETRNTEETDDELSRNFGHTEETDD